MGPRRADGKYDVLTASHCIATVGSTGKMWLRDGRTLTIKWTVIQRTPDLCWGETSDSHDELPFALLSNQLPNPGDGVWHAGYGVDIPGNTERGTVVQPDNGHGQTQFTLSVSSGDSGGGIALDREGRILSPVCCTSSKGSKASVWGATCMECLKYRPVTGSVQAEWTPIEIPIRSDD